MRNKKFYIISFLTPILVFTLVLFIKGFINGEYTILVSDMWQQYYGLFTRLKEILDGTGSLFYTYKIGLGQSFISTFAYYLASPLNLILYLFSNVENAIKFIITLKIGLCGLSMFTYLKHQFKKENGKLILFSTAYALSLQVICNYFNIMWLDAYYLAPLILLGIDKLIDDNKSILYFITLFLTISINYYMGYMTCIFSVIYFIYKLYLKYDKKDKKEIKEKVIKFLIVSILSGLSSMFINLPNLIGILSIERTESVGLSGLFNLGILKNASKLFFMGHEYSVMFNKDFVYFYFGLFTLLNLILYFFNKNINKKEKKSLLLIISILIISVLINPINKVWHVFNSPLGFNYRYYFLFLIIFIYSSCKNFIKLDDVSMKKYIGIISIFTLLGIISLIDGKLSVISLILSITLLIIYSCILFFYKNLRLNNILKICLVVLVLGELYFNATNVFEMSKFYPSNYVTYREKVKKETLDKIENSDNSKFYRIEFSNSLYNDSMLYDYNSSTGWYSTIDSRSIRFFGNFGYSTSVNQYRHINLPIVDSLMGIKYYVSTMQEVTENNTLIQNDEIELNPYYLNLGYMVSNDVLNEFICNDAYHCQNTLATQLSGENINYYIEEIVEQDGYEYSFIINNENDFVIRFPYGDSLEGFSYDIYLNGNYMQTINQDSGFVSEFENDAEVGTKINISIKNIVGELNRNEISVYYKDINEIEEMYNTLSSNQLNLTEIKDGYIKGNIEVNEDKNILFLSIPYENGWKVKVDGEEKEIISIYDTFIGIELENGTHEIELVYKTPGLKTGIIISIVSISLYGIYLYFEKKRNK